MFDTFDAKWDCPCLEGLQKAEAILIWFTFWAILFFHTVELAVQICGQSVKFASHVLSFIYWFSMWFFPDSSSTLLKMVCVNFSVVVVSLGWGLDHCLCEINTIIIIIWLTYNYISRSEINWHKSHIVYSIGRLRLLTQPWWPPTFSWLIPGFFQVFSVLFS